MATVYTTEISQETKNSLERYLNAPLNSIKRNAAFLDYAKSCEKEHKNPVAVYYKLKGKPKTH